MIHLQPDEALYTLLCKYLLNEAETLERQWVDAWRKEMPENEEALSAIRKMLDVSVPRVEYPGLSTDASWERLRNTITNPPARETIVVKRSFPWVKVAAVLVAAIGLAWWLLRQNPAEQVFSGEQQAALDDGSKINMYPGAEMTVAGTFGDKNRQVRFSGKGTFDIAQDPQSPFIISLGNTEIKVLGTRFTVDYDSSLLIHVTSGKILVTDLVKKDSVVMTEGMMLRRDESIAPFTVAGNITDVEKKQLVFRKTPLEEVLNTVSTLYDIQVEVRDSTLLQQSVIANFENENIENVMASIAFMTNTTVEQTGPRQYSLQR